MVRLETTLLDKFVNGAFAGKRKIGGALKPAIRNRGGEGWIELVFNPRNRFEQYISQAVRFAQPYLFYVTYRFHVEKARESGMRVEDTYHNKFHKEPYVMLHVYAQYFHPDTITERVRNVAFYRRPRTIFKGFKVPDWAQSENHEGWQVDTYSREAWDNAMHDLEAEMTMTPYNNRRQEPNPLQYLRFENIFGGAGTRLFYNEVPQFSWMTQQGHMTETTDEREKERALFSFTHANQDKPLVFGMDTATPEGQAAYRAEYEALCELAPEIIKKEDMVFPHQMAQQVSKEPHFRRVWQHYREHTFKDQLAKAVSSGAISEGDAAAFDNFVGMTGTPTFNLFILISQGKLTYLEGDEGYQATCRVLKALGMDTITWTDHTAAPAEEQFWAQFDDVFALSEQGMRTSLPDFVIDDGNRAKVEALLSGAGESTKRLN
jgi:hypothetical protein